MQFQVPIADKFADHHDNGVITKRHTEKELQQDSITATIPTPKPDCLYVAGFRELVYIISIVPIVFLTWLQCLFNVTMIGGLSYFAYQTFHVLKADLHKHLNHQTDIRLSEIVQCSKDFIKNGCMQSFLPPALEAPCREWKLCMEQDTEGLLVTVEFSSVLSEILNNFFGRLDNRTIFCIGGLIVGFIVLTNVLICWSKKGRRDIR